MIWKKLSLCFVIISLVRLSVTRAESCFAKIDSEGLCNQLVANDVTKDECCSVLGLGYSEELPNDGIFMVQAGMKKQACKPCREIETCENANCGVGKRCIMKKGLPKCVCAPNCKATAAANKHQKANSAKKIAVIQMSEMRNLKRNEKRLTPSEMQNDEPTLIVANFNRRQGSKKPNQRADNKKNSNEALVYSPLINSNLDHEVQISQRNTTNHTTDHDASLIEMKIRSGFFNVHTSKVTSNDDFFIGNFPKFSHYNPICGSDGKTYKNECQLRKRACRQENKMLDVSYKGHCQSSCKFIKCSNGKNCVEDQNSAPQCIACPRCSNSNKNLTSQAISKMICGADGVTYRSLCELRQKSCKLGKVIALAHRGPCTEAVNCNQCLKTQKCLPDLMTHQPKCVVCNYKCQRKRRPATGRKGDQVCGKNNITYHSWCHLMKDSCNTGFFIDIKHEGPCTGSS